MRFARLTSLSLLLVSAHVGVPASAQQAGVPLLPLKEGRYGVGGCDLYNEVNNYIGIVLIKDGPNKGHQRLVPQAERQQGFCTLTKLAPMGAVLAGVAECDNGAKVNPAPIGTYRFNYTILGPTSFSSLGKRYDWCPPGR